MFRFKRFIVNQHGAAMKVGTDGVLLGAWAKLRPQHCRYLDIGTGTGLIALMLAQRTESVGAEIDADSCEQPGASGDSTGKDKGICSQSGSGWDSTVTDIDNNGLHTTNRTGMRYGNSAPNNISVIIDAVDIDESSCVQAQENVTASEWGGRINIFNASIQQFAAKCIMKNYEIEQFTEDNIAVPIDPNTALYDHIVSNPPYFVDSLLPATHSRSVARHTKSLPYNELLSSVSHLLAPAGVFSVIIPFGNHQGFIQAAAVEGLVPTRRCMVFPLAGKPCKRVLLEFAHASFVKRDASVPEHYADSLERDASVPEHYADSLGRDASVPEQHADSPEQRTSYPLQIEDTELVIESLPDNFTPEYMALTRDFYLKF